MTTKILLNTVRIGTVTQFAGSSFDDAQESAMIATIESVGGRFASSSPAVDAAASFAIEARRRGQDVASLDSLMLALGAGGLSSVNWRPSGGGDAETWDEVMAVIDSATAPVDVWFTEFGSPGYVIPARAVPYNMKGARFIAVLGNASGNIVTIAQGAVLHDLGTIEGGVALGGTATSGGPCLTFTPPGGGSPAAIAVVNGAILGNLGTEPMIRIGPMSGGVVVAAIRGATIGIVGGPPSGPVVFLEVGANVITTAVAGAVWADGWLVNDGVDPLAGCFFQQDGNLRAPPPANSGFAGSTFNIPFGNYGGSGPTSFRPASVFGPLSIGTQYFDTDVGQPIWWNGAAWIFADGTLVP